MGLLVVFGVVLAGRLFYLQVVQHERYLAQASNEHTRKYEIPATRGELYAYDGAAASPIALNQRLKIVYADPRYVDDKAAAAQKLAGALEIGRASCGPGGGAEAAGHWHERPGLPDVSGG
jgi:cell division protein FtsI/penicillin-binding protein 2